MISFTEQDVEKIRKRAKAEPKYVEKLLEATKDVRRKIYIPEKALSTWSQYYMCPKHSVLLKFDYDDSEHYVCPVDGEVFTGEPYTGAWWCMAASTALGGAHQLAVLYMITGDESYLKLVHEILLGYAKVVPSYEVHGNVPYNKPGKIMAQVLSDAGVLIPIIRAYDITKDTFTKEEQELIEKDLLLEVANHIMTHFTEQIHNHEVWLCAAVGMVGILLDNKELVDFALERKYGLKYQLDNSVREDGMWFEGTIYYHFYALHAFLDFEKFARYTKYSLFADKKYGAKIKQMLELPLNFVDVDGIFPSINDGGKPQGTHLGLKRDHYEYAYSYFKSEKLLKAVTMGLKDGDRITTEALLYGEETFPPAPKHEVKNYGGNMYGSIGIVHGSDKRSLMFKASPYGGEHDHYDRLGIGFYAFGKGVCSDLGTCRYGAPLHYEYYKNTATHNTVCINGDNMPAGKIIYSKFEDGDMPVFDGAVAWKDGISDMPDSFTIKQWCDESYEGVTMKRRVHWFDKYFVDIFTVESDNDLHKDWTLHINGELVNKPENATKLDKIADDGKPQSYLNNISTVEGEGVMRFDYDCGECKLSIHSFASGKDVIFAKGPNNPSIDEISYIIQRTNAKNVTYINVVEAYKDDAVVESVQYADNKLIICEKDGTKREVSTQI
ncbi:MAG: alginate lyase family protein [Ruminococcaceae bacterium]|nr:alginate lyase family protein [Oscillospiraceae bacterium]